MTEPVKEIAFDRPRYWEVGLAFEDTLEKDDNVFFHGTMLDNLEKILKDGFAPRPDRKVIYYANSSGTALFYMRGWGKFAEGCCIIAVRFPELVDARIKVDAGRTQIDVSPSLQPEILCYTKVPTDL